MTNEQILRQAEESRNVQAIGEIVKTDAWRFVVVDTLSHKLSKNEVFTDRYLGFEFLDHLTATDWHYDLGKQGCRDLITLCFSMYSLELQVSAQEHLDKRFGLANASLFNQIHTLLHDQMRYATQEHSSRFTISNLVLSLCELLTLAFNLPTMLNYMYARADSIESSYDFDL